MDYGYGYGDHQYDDEEAQEHVIQKRSERRASLKATRRSSATGADAFAARKARRASMNGGRRGSFAGGGSSSAVQQSSVQGSMARRGSAGYGGGGVAPAAGGCDPSPGAAAAAASAMGKPQQQGHKRGINPEALRRLTRNFSDDQVIDDDDESFRGGINNPYGYGYEAHGGAGLPTRNYGRRPSNASRSSNRPRRRSSHASKDPITVSEITTSQHVVTDSDIEDLSESDNESTGYGYGYGVPSNKSNPYGYGKNNTYDSDANASRGSRHSHRRNSCVIRKNKDAVIMAEIEAGPQLVPDSDLDSEDDLSVQNNNKINLYGYGAPNPYGYGNNAYDSDANASRRSTRSHRRNSCVIRKNKDAAIMAEIESGPPLCPDSDLDSEDDGCSINRGMYGYGARPTSALPPGCGYDSDSTAGRTISSTRPIARRNSCLKNGKILDESDEIDAVSKELSDPDSMLSRSGFYSKEHAGKSKNEKQNKSTNALPTDGEEAEDDDSSLFQKPHMRTTTAVGADPYPVNRAISSTDVTKNKGETEWSRSTPFTTAHVAPTKDKLAEYNNSWGGMDVMSSSSDDDSRESYGASMYKDDRIHVEIDRYKQRARRRASIEASWVDLKYIAPTEKTITTKEGAENKIKVPHFKPAEGFSKASDFIVRCFSARLRSGITVLKHNRSRFSKSQYRVLYLLPDGKTLTWKPLEGEKDKGKRPKLDLSKCVEVRHAYSPDPESKKLQGTAVLRKNCRDGMAARSLSLIFGRRRTLDITALSKDLATVLLEGFSALCFRLHLLRMEEESGDHLSQEELNDDDWASTILGAPSTATITLSVANSNPADTAPIAALWGF